MDGYLIHYFALRKKMKKYKKISLIHFVNGFTAPKINPSMCALYLSHCSTFQYTRVTSCKETSTTVIIPKFCIVSLNILYLDQDLIIRVRHETDAGFPEPFSASLKLPFHVTCTNSSQATCIISVYSTIERLVEKDKLSWVTRETKQEVLSGFCVHSLSSYDVLTLHCHNYYIHKLLLVFSLFNKVANGNYHGWPNVAMSIDLAWCPTSSKDLIVIVLASVFINIYIQFHQIRMIYIDANIESCVNSINR